MRSICREDSAFCSDVQAVSSSFAVVVKLGKKAVCGLMYPLEILIRLAESDMK